MNLTPEIKAQLEEQKKQCVFCKILAKEIPGKIVFEDDQTAALLDIYPAIKGHTVFILKEHYPIMPYIPADEFKHYFGLIPQLSAAVQKAMVSTGMNVFIANGGVAGQQAPHFLLHLLPRENGDGFFNFLFDKRKASLADDKIKMLQNNFPIMMNNHFGRNPAEWHLGTGEIPSFLEDIYNNNAVVYEDEKVLCVIPGNGLTEGHIEIYSKSEEKDLSKLSIEDSAHLFFTASFAATAVFEGLGAQGTNLIIKSGFSDDNPEGKLCLHVLPRMQDDHLQGLLWQPKQPSYDLDALASKIKDKTWQVKYQEEKKEVKKEVIAPQVLTIKDDQPLSSEDEIRIAISNLKN